MKMSQELLLKNLWINNGLFENALKEQYKDETIFVKTFEVLQVLGRSQNYWCDVMKVLINYVNSTNVMKSKTLVLKIAYYNPYMSEDLSKYDPFKRELIFQRDLLPKIMGLLLSIEDKTQFTAR